MYPTPHHDLVEAHGHALNPRCKKTSENILTALKILKQKAETEIKVKQNFQKGLHSVGYFIQGSYKTRRLIA